VLRASTAPHLEARIKTVEETLAKPEDALVGAYSGD